ncbi:pyridoxamine 5'-phosphate oxidase family protein [Mycobacterium sp. 21AC1]|uniref:pyridoxamine 5'-phosphate oxidase family protein n=1 Tax=[Mycobacterium] appelbergii TaxID=2939269 RepID=UPI0029390787|nr:pyridoxamine 5'-phosphate oxidase family protein [Mycobacterium sp. 21AC1]MDV3124501.1 pyridoxamine 5'-phosphate oxidase family protein [Mycobacterium sp. 21AC1]
MADFLRHNRRAFLFCRDGSGRPIGYAMQSIGYKPANLYFATYVKSPKVKHLLADPAVACIVLGECDGTVRPWVSVRGTAEVYRPSVEEIHEMIGMAPSDRRVPESVVASVRDRLIVGKRCFIRLALDEVVAARLCGGDNDVRQGDRAI